MHVFVVVFGASPDLPGLLLRSAERLDVGHGRQRGARRAAARHGAAEPLRTAQGAGLLFGGDTSAV